MVIKTQKSRLVQDLSGLRALPWPLCTAQRHGYAPGVSGSLPRPRWQAVSDHAAAKPSRTRSGPAGSRFEPRRKPCQMASSGAWRQYTGPEHRAYCLLVMKPIANMRDSFNPPWGSGWKGRRVRAASHLCAESRISTFVAGWTKVFDLSPSGENKIAVVFIRHWVGAGPVCLTAGWRAVNGRKRIELQDQGKGRHWNTDCVGGRGLCPPVSSRHGPGRFSRVVSPPGARRSAAGGPRLVSPSAPPACLPGFPQGRYAPLTGLRHRGFGRSDRRSATARRVRGSLASADRV